MDDIIPARNQPERSLIRRTRTPCHILAVPYPGRDHINPLLNLCKIISSRMDNFTAVTVVVTDEWLSLIGTDPKPDTIRFETIPNVLPLDNMVGFLGAVWMKMEEFVGEVVDRVQIEKPVTIILADCLLNWAVDVGNRRNIPVALLWTMSTFAFSVFYHLHRFFQYASYVPGEIEEVIECIPGASSMCMGDLPTLFHEQNLNKILETFPNIQKAKCLLLSTVFDLEPQIITTLTKKLPFPIYSVGPLIPFFNLIEKPASKKITHEDYYHLKWLDSQPANSVLYISMGSFLSVSSTQMEEIAAGLRDSGVTFLWIAHGDTLRLEEIAGPAGLILPWCDQLNILCHPSIGGFWTNCGWNSTMESIFAGIPMLTFPLSIDQFPNSHLIVDNWKVGWRVKGKVVSLPTRGEIAELVFHFMCLDNEERKAMVNKVKVLQSNSKRALEAGGSSITNLNMFLGDLGKGTERGSHVQDILSNFV